MIVPDEAYLVIFPCLSGRGQLLWKTYMRISSGRRPKYARCLDHFDKDLMTDAN